LRSASDIRNRRHARSDLDFVAMHPNAESGIVNGSPPLRIHFPTSPRFQILDRTARTRPLRGACFRYRETSGEAINEQCTAQAPGCDHQRRPRTYAARRARRWPAQSPTGSASKTGDDGPFRSGNRHHLAAGNGLRVAGFHSSGETRALNEHGNAKSGASFDGSGSAWHRRCRFPGRPTSRPSITSPNQKLAKSFPDRNDRNASNPTTRSRPFAGEVDRLSFSRAEFRQIPTVAAG